MSVNQFYENYSSKGFNFSNELLTRYCLSLYTKPFVILSGISGTGKTKIAQLFETVEESETDIQEPNIDDGYILMTVTAGVRDGDGRGNFQFSALDVVFEENELQSIQARIDQLIEEDRDDNITEVEEFTVVTPHGEITVGCYLQRASSPLLRVRFKSKRGQTPEYDSRTFLQRHYLHLI